MSSSQLSVKAARGRLGRRRSHPDRVWAGEPAGLRRPSQSGGQTPTGCPKGLLKRLSLRSSTSATNAIWRFFLRPEARS
jgi:hypothetical protein